MPSSKLSQNSGRKRILIVRLGALGDIVHALPAQQQLAQRLPEAEIHWLAEPRYAPLLESVPGVARVWVADTKQWRRRPLRSRRLVTLIRSLRKQGFEFVFDFQGLIKSALLAGLSGASKVIGFAPERFKENGIQWFYSDAAPGESDLSRHVIDVNLDLIRRIVPEAQPQTLVPLAIPPDDQRYAQQRLDDLGIRRPILINPGAGWATKLWPAIHYARLGLEIERTLGIPVVYTHGPGEEGLIEEIRRANAPAPVMTFPTTLLQLAALCRLSRLMTAGDSGPLHLAVAMGTPTVAILGPTAARRNGPYNPEDLVVKRNLPCSDSYKRLCDNFICMDIPVERVLEAVVRRLRTVADRVVSAPSLAVEPS